jgi:preprotein translocase subunit SecG
MSQTQSTQRSGPNIYTVLLMIAIAALILTATVLLHDLMSEQGDGMTFGEIFGPLSK